MKKFKFRLEQVLRFRRIVKDEKRRILAEANLELAEAEAHLGQLQLQLSQLSTSSTETLGVEAYYLAGMYAQRLESEILQQKEIIVIRQESVRVALADYVEASKELKTLDTLKSRKLAAYNEFVLNEDAKFLDELATQKGNTLKQG